MRWEPLIIITLMASVAGLFILATGRRHRWAGIIVLTYLTGLAVILFTPLSFSGTGVYIMPPGMGRVNLTHFDLFNLGFAENIALTLPIGLALKWLAPKLSLLGVGAFGLFVGSGIETLQYILSNHWLINRSSDINDVLANALGILIGGMMVAIYLRLSNKQHTRQRVLA